MHNIKYITIWNTSGSVYGVKSKSKSKPGCVSVPSHMPIITCPTFSQRHARPPPPHTHRHTFPSLSASLASCVCPLPCCLVRDCRGYFIKGPSPGLPQTQSSPQQISFTTHPGDTAAISAADSVLQQPAENLT